MKKILMIATTRLCVDGLTEILLKVARIATREHSVDFAFTKISPVKASHIVNE